MAKPRRKYLNKKLLNEILAAFELETTNYKHYMIALTHSTYANENNLSARDPFPELFFPVEEEIETHG